MSAAAAPVVASAVSAAMMTAAAVMSAVWMWRHGRIVHPLGRDPNEAMFGCSPNGQGGRYSRVVHPARSDFYANEPSGFWWTYNVPYREQRLCQTNGRSFVKQVQESMRTKLRPGTYRTSTGTTFDPRQITLTGIWTHVLSTALAAYARQQGDDTSAARLATLAERGQIDRFAVQFGILVGGIEGIEWQHIVMPPDMVLPTMDRPPPDLPRVHECLPLTPATPVERQAPRVVQQPRVRSDVGTAAVPESAFGSPTSWQSLGTPGLADLRLAQTPYTTTIPSTIPGSEDAVRQAGAPTAIHPAWIFLGVGVAAVVVWQLVRRD